MHRKRETGEKEKDTVSMKCGFAAQKNDNLRQKNGSAARKSHSASVQNDNVML